MDNITKAYLNMLTEATDDDVRRVTKANPTIDQETIKKYASDVDPKEGSGSRYLDWLVKGHKNGSHALEDATRLKTALVGFEQNKSKMPNKDINQYKHISEVEDALAEHAGVMSETQKADPKTYFGKPQHHEKIFDNGDGLQVYHTKTKEASQAIYGGGHRAGGCHTSWCTAGRGTENRFDHYSKSGKNPLFQIHTPDGAVYQDEFSDDYSGGLRDARDVSVDRKDLVSKHPDLAKVPAFQGKDLAYADDDHVNEALHNEIRKGNYSDVLEHPKVETEHIGHILGSNYIHPTLQEKAMDHPKFSSENMMSLAKTHYHNEDVLSKMLKHPKLGDEHIQEIFSHPGYSQTKVALFNQSDRLTPQHISSALAHPEPKTRALAVNKATEEEKEQATHDDDYTVRSTAMTNLKNPDTIEKHYDRMAASGIKYTPEAISNNKNTNESTLRKAYNALPKGTSDNYLKSEMVQHKNAPSDIISDYIHHNIGQNTGNNIIALKKTPNINSDHVKSVFSDPHPLVKQAALMHARAPKEIIDSSIGDTKYHGAISVSKAASPEHLHTLSKSPHQFIRNNVAMNKNTSKETLQGLLSDPDSEVSDSATKSLSKKK